MSDQLFAAQKDLILVMGELATAREDLDRYVKGRVPSHDKAMVDRLTSIIDELEKDKLLHYQRTGRFRVALPVLAALDVARDLSSCGAPSRDTGPRRPGFQRRNPAISESSFGPVLASGAIFGTHQNQPNAKRRQRGNILFAFADAV